MRPFKTPNAAICSGLKFTSREDMELIDDVFALLQRAGRLIVFVKTPEACDALLALMREEGRKVKCIGTHKRADGGKDEHWQAWYPQGFKECVKYPKTDVWVPEIVSIRQWFGSPLPRGQKLFQQACFYSGILADASYYFQDQQDTRSEISDEMLRVISRFLYGFSVIPGNEWIDFPLFFRAQTGHDNVHAAASFIPAFKIFCS